MNYFHIFVLCIVFCISNLKAQIQSNDFEFNNNLSIQIDSLSSDSIWQIGMPQKVNLNQALSPPNVLISDTLYSYPADFEASFIVELNENTVSFFPYIQIEWFQSTDFEDGIDGGIIEASYDQGQTWSNIFDDPNYRPEVVGSYQWDTLHNGKAGVTGSTNLAWMAICWGSYIGNQPSNVTTIQIRFTLTSDSIDTEQEGWLFDNFTVVNGVIGSTNNQIEYQSFPIIPNPANSEIALDLSQINRSQANIHIFNNFGKVVYSNSSFIINEIELSISFIINEIDNSISVADLFPGIYYVVVKTDEVILQQKFIKIN